MNETQSYEKIVKRKKEGSLLLATIALIASYVIFAAVGILLVFLFADGHPTLLLLVAALDFSLWLMTHKLVDIEYEYTFAVGSFYLSRILGKASRKELFEEELSNAVTVAPYNGQYKEQLQRQELKKVFSAVSSKNARDVWFILFEGEGGVKNLVIFEADERSLKRLRQGAPRAVVRERLTNTQSATEDLNNA